MASQRRMTAGDRTAIGAGALALFFGAAIGAAPIGCGFYSTGRVQGAGGAGGMTVSSNGSGGTTSTGMACSPPDCNDHDPCTKDTCSAGVCSHKNEAAGMACGTGLTCNDQGKCTGCSATTPCAPGTPCTPIACVMGACVPQPIAEAEPCMAMSMMGVCNATGVCVTCLDQGTPPAPGCMNMDYCSAGACASCTDTKMTPDGDETDVNCGGSHCPKCVDGKACKGMDDCSSGQCVAGVCCDSACSNTTSGTKCESCTLPGQVGTCTKMPSGVDGSPSCGMGSACNGAGVCQATMGKGTIGAVCNGDGNCANTHCKLGACRLRANEYCNTNVECDTDFCSPQHKCAMCANDIECAPAQCVGGNCKLPNTALCGSDGDCEIDKCTNRFCGLQIGVSCTTEAECGSHRCANGSCAVCFGNSDCGANGACFAAICLAFPGDYCGSGTDCASMTCMPSPIFGRCQ